MKIDFTLHSEISALAASGLVSWKDYPVEPSKFARTVEHTVDAGGSDLRLVIDHSHFTAHRTEFSITGGNAGERAADLLRSVQELIISLQNRTFEMLGSVNSAVINSLDHNEIVHNVLKEVMNVLPHSDAGVFRLFDEASGMLIPVSYDGLPEDYAHYRLQPNESVSGEVFSSGKPAIHNGRQNIIDAHRIMRPESQSFMERSNIANALLCVPVMADGRRLGTLTTLSFSPSSAFSVFDQTILGLLATQVAVAYRRSLDYQNAVADSQRLEQLRIGLVETNAELDRAVELHESLLRIFSAPDDLSEQLQSVSGLYEVQFMFENAFGQSYQSRDWTQTKTVLSQPVEIANVIVGQFHYVASEDLGFHRALFGTLAAFVALDFYGDMSRLDAQNVRRLAYFDALAIGTDTKNRPTNHGFRAERFNQVIVALMPMDGSSGASPLSLQKTMSDLQKAMTLSNTLIFYHEERVVILASAPTNAALQRNRQALSECGAALELFIGTSDIYEDATQHQSSRQSAQHAAEALLRRRRPGLISHGELGLELLLAGQGRDEILRFSTGVLATLLQDPKNLALLETLSRYIQEGKSATKTAAALNIHQNTLYQRLAKIETLTGRKMSNALDFTLLSVACQLHTTYSSGADR